MKLDNKVIILGGNHHNTLGVVRSFGVNGISPYGVVIGKNAKQSFVRRSRHWKKTWAVESEQEAIELITKEFCNENNKPVLVPCSDGIAHALDTNLDSLMKRFILPSINGQQGAIVSLMDKHNQVEFSRRHNLPVAKSWEIHFSNDSLPDDLIYPCIFKPIVSAAGNKTDITRCDTYNEAVECFIKYKQAGYTKALIQQYLTYDFELNFIGCCGKDCASLLFKKIRIWPSVGGSSSFLQCFADEGVIQICDKIMNILVEVGYSGLFDIDLFYTKETVYLNEINWRSSGNTFVALGSNVHYAVIWYYSMIGRNIHGMKHIYNDTNAFYMNEPDDRRHIKIENISLLDWLRDCKKVASFAIWNKDDLNPFWAYWKNTIVSRFASTR